ncbi:aminotransferase class V-fold PLP-dependent enzyme [Aquipuribacter sp. SD81]|uniref:aminotransferase class V-fold PLP-dependent enzyme n=1 Tax=Aquipuribacter sp. SD81 TaxID=3127703 RepID=UPI00301AE96E
MLLDPVVATAEQLDAADPLGGFRARFAVGTEPLAYLDGNSLGRPPLATLDRLRRLHEHEWAVDLIRGWERWQHLPVQVGDQLGAGVLGAAAGQVVVADSTSVCLFKALHAAAALRPGRDELVASSGDFPTDRYLVEAVARSRGATVRWVEPHPVDGLDPAALAAVLGKRTALVLLSHVDYRSAALADLAAVTALVHGAGAVVVWDLSHSAGSVPLALDDAGVDLAVGCTYKYLCAGPGAPAFLYAAERHHERLENPVPGWFGAEDVFAMAAGHVPARGVRRMLSGTPPVAGLVAVQEGVRVVGEAGLPAIREKSVALTARAAARLEHDLGARGWSVASPADPARRGSHVVLAGPGARGVERRARERGVLADLRHPDLVRLGLSPLTTSFAELDTALDVLVDEALAGD